jgi:hypothetical protein
MKEGKFFVSVAGNIGSGKSSLTEIISKEFGWKPYFEKVDTNPYLKDFYADMSRWSFNLQVYFLSHRFSVHKKIIQSKKSVIQDRSIYEDVEIFAENLYRMGRMKKRDYDNYRMLFAEMTSFLKPPDLLIYLRAGLPKLMKQIRLRGRDFEKTIEKDYILRLNKSYDDWIERYTLGNKLIIETDSLDFVNKKKDLQKITDLMNKNLPDK